jgi:hypothetical protein
MASQDDDLSLFLSAGPAGMSSDHVEQSLPTALTLAEIDLYSMISREVEVFDEFQKFLNLSVTPEPSQPAHPPSQATQQQQTPLYQLSDITPMLDPMPNLIPIGVHFDDAGIEDGPRPRRKARKPAALADYVVNYEMVPLQGGSDLFYPEQCILPEYDDSLSKVQNSSSRKEQASPRRASTDQQSRARSVSSAFEEEEDRRSVTRPASHRSVSLATVAVRPASQRSASSTLGESSSSSTVSMSPNHMLLASRLSEEDQLGQIPLASHRSVSLGATMALSVNQHSPSSLGQPVFVSVSIDFFQPHASARKINLKPLTILRSPIARCP